MLAAGLEGALSVALHRDPPGARERRRGERRERRPVVPEELQLRLAFAVARLALGEGQTGAEQAPVVRLHVSYLRHRREEILPDRPNPVLHQPLLIPRAGVGEAVTDPVMRGKAVEERGGGDLRVDPAADLGSVVEDGAQRHAPDELNNAPEPLADALRVSPQNTWTKPTLEWGERDHEEMAPVDHAAHAEVRLAEVDLALAGQPVEQEEPLHLADVEPDGELLCLVNSL